MIFTAKLSRYILTCELFLLKLISLPQNNISQNADHNTTRSVSRTFYPEACLDKTAPDLIVVTADSVLFYVHSHIMVGSSGSLRLPLLSIFPSPPAESFSSNPEIKDEPCVAYVEEDSDVLNVILHMAYNISCAWYCSSFNTLATAVDTLSAYGLSAKRILPSTPLYAVLLYHAHLLPLEIYTLAAHHGLDELATSTSAHLLSFSLCTLTDKIAEAMGPVYLRRLFFLHLGRVDALKRVIRSPPIRHVPTSICDLAEQEKLATAWNLAGLCLSNESNPGEYLSLEDQLTNAKL